MPRLQDLGFLPCCVYCFVLKSFQRKRVDLNVSFLRFGIISRICRRWEGTMNHMVLQIMSRNNDVLNSQSSLITNVLLSATRNIVSLFISFIWTRKEISLTCCTSSACGAIWDLALNNDNKARLLELHVNEAIVKMMEQQPTDPMVRSHHPIGH